MNLYWTLNSKKMAIAGLDIKNYGILYVIFVGVCLAAIIVLIYKVS